MPARDAAIREISPNQGEKNKINQPFMCDYGTNITMGDDNFLNHGVTILDVGEVVIGSNCQVSPSVMIITAYHPKDPEERAARIQLAKKVVIGNNVWLGAGCVINPGVTVGDNSIVGAGAVVVHDVPANVVVAGVPAKVIEQLKPLENML